MRVLYEMIYIPPALTNQISALDLNMILEKCLEHHTRVGVVIGCGESWHIANNYG